MANCQNFCDVLGELYELPSRKKEGDPVVPLRAKDNTVVGRTWLGSTVSQL